MRLPPLDIPPSTGPLSNEIADAASELACRIDMGEFDDLDDVQMAELRVLAGLMLHWARHARAMEQGQPTALWPRGSSGGHVAFCN